MTQTTFVVETDGPGLTEITDRVADWLAAEHAGDGLLTLFLRHTSASLLIQENADLDVRRDLDAFFARLIPRANAPEMAYLRHRAEGPDDMPAHIRAADAAGVADNPGCGRSDAPRHLARASISGSTATVRIGGRSRRISHDPEVSPRG